VAYSSKDFVSVAPRTQVTLPIALIHRQVEKTGSANGFSEERGHGVAVVDLPTHTISMTIGHLGPEQATRRHRHNYETVLFILEGRGESVIEDKVVSWEKGDALYIPSWAWHHHRNVDSSLAARYVACENAPLLQNLGNVALREEAQ